MESPLTANFSKKNFFVVSDVMLDAYLYGETTRISPEAPIPVVKITSRDYF